MQKEIQYIVKYYILFFKQDLSQNHFRAGTNLPRGGLNPLFLSGPYFFSFLIK